jgi:hypothetical protein
MFAAAAPLSLSRALQLISGVRRSEKERRLWPRTEMRFTSAAYEFWGALQLPGEKGLEAARQWDALSAEARQSLASLEGRLSEPASRFFTESSFHDGSVVSIKVVDRRVESSLGRFRRWRFPTNVEILVLHPQTSTPWTLTYSKVRLLTLETLASDPDDADRGFFEWGYDRLSADKDGMMRHEILFSSGSALELSFEQLTLARASRARRRRGSGKARRTRR